MDTDIARSREFDDYTDRRTLELRAPRLGVLATHAIQYQAPLYQELARRATVQLDVAYLSAKGAEHHYEPDFGISVTWDLDLLVGYQWSVIASSSYASRAKWIVALAAWLRKHEVVVLHGHADPETLMAMALCKLLRIPYLLRGDAQAESGAKGFRRLARYLLASTTVKGAAGALAIGQSNSEFYTRYGAIPQFWAPYSVDNERFGSAADTARPSRIDQLTLLNLDPHQPVAIFSGKLIARKRPLDAVRAIELCEGQISLLVIGDGPLRAEVQAYEKRLPIRCLGFVNQTELPRWYACGDLLVLPSTREPWGLVVNEAMACGLVPVVSDAVGCAPDLVQGIGQVFPMGDIAQLATSLLRAADKPPGLGTMIRRKIEHFTTDETARGYERAALACRRSPRT